jgi:hypothetical protein
MPYTKSILNKDLPKIVIIRNKWGGERIFINGSEILGVTEYWISRSSALAPHDVSIELQAAVTIIEETDDEI